METIKRSFVFQTDSAIVQEAYQRDNYNIVFNEACNNKSICAIYFSSNDIYYPNEASIFQKRILEKDFYEWYNTRVENAYKHIFIRDTHKQWYLSGINSRIDSPEKLLLFLKHETNGFSVITLGSSAGGYAAVLYGQLLGAEASLSFNGQFMLTDLLESSTEEINPLVFRFCYDEKMREYYSLKGFISRPETVFHFFSNKSNWDMSQINHISGIPINMLSFRTSHHGIPFLKVALKKVINTPIEQLRQYALRESHPFLFTIKFAGLKETVIFIFQLLFKKWFKKG